MFPSLTSPSALKIAVGATCATITDAVATLVNPSALVTVSVTVYVTAVRVRVLDGCAASRLAVPKAPRVRRDVVVRIRGPVPSKSIGDPSAPEYGPPAFATGAAFVGMMSTHQPRVTEPIVPPRLVSSRRKRLHVPLGLVPRKTASVEPYGSAGAPAGIASGEPTFVGLYVPLGRMPPDVAGM